MLKQSCLPVYILTTLVKTGFLGLIEGQKEAERVQVQLSKETFLIQKEESFFVNPVQKSVDGQDIDSSRERTVPVKRQKVGGLGLSIKGGAEHNIPVLVSRIFKDQAADQTGQLFVGDAILKVNGMSIEHATHDEAVVALKNAGTEVTLTVRHFRAATPYLKQAAKLADRGKEEINHHDDSTDSNMDGWQTRNATLSLPEDDSPEANQPKLQKRWVDVGTIPLQMARVTRYQQGTDKQRSKGFEVIAMNGASSGLLLCQNTGEVADWTRAISANIATVNAQAIQVANTLLSASEHILHYSWVEERHAPTPMQGVWKPKFFVLKGPDIMLFDNAPSSNRDWERCDQKYKLYEVISRIFKDSELMDNRPHCFLLQSGEDEAHYIGVETRNELNIWQSAILRATHMAVAKLGSKTYGCTWKQKVAGLCLDLENGFTLFDAQNKSILWRYRFSHLKNSADDGQSQVKLHFFNKATGQLESQELECPHLRKLLHCTHAFLASKLASVDPTFMKNMNDVPSVMKVPF
ncbi:gamma-2-syntrophin-like isoform X3 [Apostichopus japonicus]|uniref:gamma-2-syntrophin-like isoform X3 n=1 Tax=Stichopus japonicus TaxID=307972 RepID=UPI003AB51814